MLIIETTIFVINFYKTVSFVTTYYTLQKKMANADAHRDAGNKYFKNEDYRKAITCYKEGLHLDPGNPTLNCNLAQAYLAVKEYADAEVHAVVTIALQTDSVKGFYRATKAALGMCKKERALSYLRNGLLNCPKAEELRSLYEEICKERGDAVSLSSIRGRSNFEIPESEKESDKESSLENAYEPIKLQKNATVSESDCGDRISRGEQSKQRSRSTGTRNRSLSTNSEDKGSLRSTSVNRSSNKTSKNKKPIDPKSDKFLETLVKIQSELPPEEKSPQLREREALMEKQKKLQSYMKEGSEAHDIGLSKQASEKYKSALDIMTECSVEVFGLSEVDRVILKYSLSICWIETRNYNNIIQSIVCLTEIETNNAAELPAVYFGLGQALFRLNRFKVALQHLGKGVQVIQKNICIIPHRWPGTIKTIPESTEVGLKESIDSLVEECKIYREPDAVCRYKRCLTVSTHICPSEIIFCSDPDFVGYVVIICQENCKITYHVGCWKHYKENLSSVRKLTDKDMLGQTCLTSDCISERNEISLIVRIEVYGDDGKIKTSCSKEPTKTDNVNEHRKEKKKKNEKIEKPIKVKLIRPKVRKFMPTIQVQNTAKKAKRKIAISSEEFADCIQRLDDLRKINFGFSVAENWNPQSNYFGRSDIARLETYLSNSKDSEMLRERKNFIFTFFYEYLNDEGPQKLLDIEKKWQEDVSQFPGVNEFLSQHDGMCDFLLQSYRFACVDDYLCLAHQLADTYYRVQEEVGVSTSFILNNSSHSIEDDPEDDSIFLNKCDDKLVESSAVYSPSPNFHVDEHEQDWTAVSGSDSPAERQWTHRDSACESYITQETSDASSGEETDDEVMESPDSENEYNPEHKNIEDYPDSQHDENEVVSEQRSLPLDESIPLKFNEHFCQTSVSLPDSMNISLIQAECQIMEHHNGTQIELSDVGVQCTDLVSDCLPAVKNADAQTDNFYDYGIDIEILKSLPNKLTEETQKWNKEKEKFIAQLEELNKDYKQRIQMYENKISDLVTEKEKNLNEFHREIALRDNRIDIIKKKHQEQIDKFSRKKEEDSSLLKKNLESMTELTKEVEKQANIINRLEGQLRRSNEQVLNTRKLFGEYKLDSYLQKCKERLHCMNVVIKYLQEPCTPSTSDLKTAVDAWEAVATELQETRDLLQVQYDILSQQLKNKVSSDCLLQLELSELPKEPQYPLENMDNIMHLAFEYVQHKKPEQIEKNIPETAPSEHVSHSINRTTGYQPPLLGAPVYQSHGDLYGMMSTNPYGYRPSFFANSYNPFSRNMPSSHHGQHFKPLSSNEGSNGAVPRPWTSEFPASALKKENTESLNFGDKQNLHLPVGKDNSLSNNMTFRNLSSKSTESLSSGESEVKGNVKVPDTKGGLPGTKYSGLFLEKKNVSSSVSGLTPIEITKSVVSDAKVLSVQNSKPVNSEMKQGLQTQKRWNYQRLLEELQKNFRMKSEAELSECLFILREKNGNKLSGLSVSTIIRRVEKLLEERSNKKVGNMGMDKFGGAAWGEVKENDVTWQNDDLENECIICHLPMEDNKTKLQCKHLFHTECIRKWLHTNSTCPICRKYTRLVDEFPPLS